MRNRAYRRAERERVIERTRKWMRSYGLIGERFSVSPQSDQDIAVRKRAATPHPCSGPCCGNPRHWYKGQDAITWQERKAPYQED